MDAACRAIRSPDQSREPHWIIQLFTVCLHLFVLVWSSSQSIKPLRMAKTSQTCGSVRSPTASRQETSKVRMIAYASNLCTSSYEGFRCQAPLPLHRLITPTACPRSRFSMVPLMVVGSNVGSGSAWAISRNKYSTMMYMQRSSIFECRAWLLFSSRCLNLTRCACSVGTLCP